jgi:triacylglycerol lipase
MAGKHRLFAVTAVLFFSLSLLAQDPRRNSSQPRANRLRKAATNAVHVGAFDAPPDEDDTVFVTDTGPGMDTDCTYRGTITIRIPVKRYAGEVGFNETLRYADEMVSSGLISATAKLSIPAWDVDVDYCCQIPPEIDKVYFNDQYIGNLSGTGGYWKLNEFNIPINQVKFPSPGFGGSAIAYNTVTIYIDTASPGESKWCTAVDWAALEFKAIAPVMLIHGTNASHTTWDGPFLDYLTSKHVPLDHMIDLEANGSILNNAALLSSKLNEVAQSFGAKKLNLITHSKGGSDSRAYLNQWYDSNRFKVLSLYTLDTPSRGTILSDVIVAARDSQRWMSNDADIRTAISAAIGAQDPALRDQTTYNMATFNARFSTVPGDVKFYNYGADADLSGNGRIESNETSGLIPWFVPGFLSTPAANAAYQLLGKAATVRLTYSPAILGSATVTDIEISSWNNPFLVNDLVTTARSANAPSGFYLGTKKANHTTIKSAATAEEILQRILSDYPNR